MPCVLGATPGGQVEYGGCCHVSCLHVVAEVEAALAAGGAGAAAAARGVAAGWTGPGTGPAVTLHCMGQRGNRTNARRI